MAEQENKEGVVMLFHPSWKGMIGWYAKWLLVATVISIIAYFALATGWFVLALFVSFGVVLGIGWLTRYNVSYKVTNQRIFESRGILNRKYESAFFSQITNTVVDQSLSERMLHVGHLSFDTAGERNVTSALSRHPGAEHYLDWWGVKNPRKVEDLIDDLRLKAIS